MTDVQKKWLRRGVVGVLIFWFFLQLGAMFFHVGGGFMRGFSRFIAPPAWVGFSPVSYHQVVETAHAFVALEIAPSYQEAFPLALGFVLRDERLMDLLPEGDVVFEDDLLTEEDRTLLLSVGISEREQVRYIIDPLLRLRSGDSLRDETLPSHEMRIQNVLEKVDLGMPFTDIARYFSEDSSAMNGGDLGVFLLSELPVWAQAVAEMEVGDVRADFVGTDAFWVLKVVERGGADEEAWVQMYGIAINKPTLGAVLRAHAADHPSWVFVW